MARYSRRNGPPAPQPITTTLTPISGTEIARSWDSGTILILWQAAIQDGADPANNITLRPHLDGATLGANASAGAGTPNTSRTLTCFILTDITEGSHTFDLRINTADAVHDSVVPTLAATLVVIQLPDWEPTLNLA